MSPALFAPASRATLEAATPPGALCVVGPDDSGCIAFYFLHKKGFGFDEPGQLAALAYSGQPYLADCVANGARYLYTTDSTGLQDPSLQPYLAHEIKRVGEYRVWELRAAPSKP